jgi:hypothetical protein
MKTIKATMPATIKNSMAVKLSANISNDDKVIKDFVRHSLFKDFFIREAGVFAPETECYRFSVPGHSDMEVSVIRSSMTYGVDEGLFELAMLRNDKCCYDTPITDDVRGWLEVEDVLDILKDVQRIYGGI